MEQRTELINGLVDNEVNRRAFAQRLLSIGSVAMGAGVLATSQAEVLAQSLSDVDILNFALNLEYLEAEFYTVGTYGQRIADIGIGISGVGRSGPTLGGAAVPLTGAYRVASEQIAIDEQEHVRLLRDALGSAAVAKPTINLEALGIGFRNQNEFLTLARAFEDLGMSAYGGAASLIGSRAILGTAAQIALTEAQHVGVIRLLVAMAGIPVPQFDGLDVPPLGSPAGRLFQVGGNGTSTIRPANLVLAVAYGNRNPGTRSGGFFPDGLNGAIVSV